MFFLESLEQAINDDEIFGDDFYERMQPKAIVTRDGIEDLIHQCIELDIVLSQPSTPDGGSATSSTASSPLVGPLSDCDEPTMKMKRSKLAKRQMKLKREEEAWIAQMLRTCNEELHHETGFSERADSGLGIMKEAPAVVVNEVTPV
jgi:hypothetical protein